MVRKIRKREDILDNGERVSEKKVERINEILSEKMSKINKTA
jgi:hypothetical protein